MKSATKMYESSRLYVVARSNTAFEAACALRRAGPATRARKPAPLDTTAPLL